MSDSAELWVSQADAVKLLQDSGDKISQQALSEYLKKHPEVAKRQEGRRIWVHWPSLKASRATRAARGPASQAPLLDLVQEPAPAEPAEAPKPARIVDPLGARRAEADTARAEAEARHARVRAAEAEGRVINRDVAVNAFTTAGIAMVRAMEEARMTAVDEVRAATDVREAVLAMRKYESKVRSAFANQLTEFAAADEPALAAAE